MKRSLLLTILLSLALFLHSGSARGQVGAPPQLYGDSAYATEEHWIVAQVGQYLGDFGALARGEPAKWARAEVSMPTKAEGGAKFQLKYGEQSGEVWVKTGVWHPRTYVDWGKPLFPAGNLEPLPVDAAALAYKLLQPDPKVLWIEGDRISQALRDRPTSARAHVQAALLVGTHGLNEHAGRFDDARIYLSRMTAHQAAALALGMDEGDQTYQLAEVIRLTLTQQQADALEQLSEWEKGGKLTGPYRGWEQVLRLRNTLDWRDLEEPARKGSLALQREYYRALVQGASVARALQFWEDIGKPIDAAYWRIANQASLSVTESHFFTKSIVKIETEEAMKLSRYLGTETSTRDIKWLKAALDTPEGSPVQLSADKAAFEVEVAGKNLLAGMQQRRLMFGFAKLYYFLERLWGVPEQAEELKKVIREDLPELRFKPFLVRMVSWEGEEAQLALSASNAAIAAHPEMVPSPVWVPRKHGVQGEVLPRGADPLAWFNPPLPTGSAYFIGWRIVDLGLSQRKEDAVIHAAYNLAPHDYFVSREMACAANGHRGRLKPADVTKYLGKLAEYDLRAMKEMARAHQTKPKVYEETMKRVAEIDPDEYTTMGSFFERMEDPAKAKEYYWQAYRKATDRVQVANTSGTLVRLLYEDGEKGRALEVAEEGAETYSSRGLKTYAWLMMQERRWADALETYQRIDERYGNGAGTDAAMFLLQLNKIDPPAAQLLGYQEAAASLYPNGKTPATLADFSGPPALGVTILNTSERLEAFGLRKGMVIVALNGFRVDGYQEYVALLEAMGTHLDIIAWDGSKYVQASGEVPDQKFGVNLRSYKAD